MWAGGLSWILREDRSRQAAFTTNSGFLARAEDQPGCPPSPHACARTGTPAHAELGNVSNADRGQRGMGAGTRETTQQDQEAAGVAAELQDSL